MNTQKFFCCKAITKVKKRKILRSVKTMLLLPWTMSNWNTKVTILQLKQLLLEDSILKCATMYTVDLLNTAYV